MISVERIEQLANIETEAPRETPMDKSVSGIWPNQGVIEFADVKLRYRTGLPHVLKGLSLVIPGRSKVGIVGRTGAGTF
jgi:ABC-type multidrug transport system fused ATPase/permease subunit